MKRSDEAGEDDERGDTVLLEGAGVRCCCAVPEFADELACAGLWRIGRVDVGVSVLNITSYMVVKPVSSHRKNMHTFGG